MCQMVRYSECVRWSDIQNVSDVSECADVLDGQMVRFANVSDGQICQCVRWPELCEMVRFALMTWLLVLVEDL
jgi:hypothetical protein